MLFRYHCLSFMGLIIMMQQLYGGGVQRAQSKLREQRSECRQTLWAPVMALLSLNLSMRGNGAQLKPHSTSENSWRDLQLKSPKCWFHCSHHLHLKLQDHLLCLYSVYVCLLAQKEARFSAHYSEANRLDKLCLFSANIWPFFPGAAHLGPHILHPCAISLCCSATINCL